MYFSYSFSQGLAQEVMRNLKAKDERKIAQEIKGIKTAEAEKSKKSVE